MEEYSQQVATSLGESGEMTNDQFLMAKECAMTKPENVSPRSPSSCVQSLCIGTFSDRWSAAIRHLFAASLLAIFFLFVSSGEARINVVTLPGRNSVQLTIYNSADLTLVKETRLLTFRKGLNRLEFSWANTLIDPTSVEFRAVTHADEVEVLDVSFPPRVTNTLEWRIKSEFAGDRKS